MAIQYEHDDSESRGENLSSKKRALDGVRIMDT
jgi:hypothetical protein